MRDATTAGQHYRPGETIMLAPHDPAWAAAFEREASALADAVPDLPVALHHIGSTAVPGIVAKPVIDMLGVVPSCEAMDAHAHQIAELGYEALGEFGIPGRRYFRKDAPNGVRTHQLHVFAAGSPEIRRHLAFRDYLRAFPERAAAYAALKQELAARHGGDTRAYTEGKTAFVREVERRAAAHLAAVPVLVRLATVADAPRLSQLGADTFRDTFGRDNTPGDMARYVADAFTPERQAAEIADPAGTMLLAEQQVVDGDAQLVGYAHLLAGPAPAPVRGPAPIELKRLYVAHAWHGRGVAQVLMNAAVDAARARGAETLWLGVWERNARAAAFYGKYGFARVGAHTFVLGADAQTDRLLARPIGGTSTDGTRFA